MMRLAQRYLLDPMGRQRTEVKASQVQAKPRQRSPAAGRVFRSRTSASLTQPQIRSRRQSQQRGGAPQPVVQGSSGDVTATPVTATDTAGRTDRSEQNFKRTGTGPVGKVAIRRSNHSLVQPIRVKSLRFLRGGKNPLRQGVIFQTSDQRPIQEQQRVQADLTLKKGEEDWEVILCTKW